MGKLSLIVLLSTVIAGCDVRGPARSSQESVAKSSRKRADSPKNGKVATAGEAADKNRTKARGAADDPSESWLPPLGSAAGSTFVGTGARNASWAGGRSFTESQALERIERELNDALQVRPTLVVWLFDQSAAAGPLRRAAIGAAAEMHGRLLRTQEKTNGGSAHKLFTAIVAFGSKVNLLTPDPVEDAAKLPPAEKIAEEPAASTQALAAIHEAAKRFAPYRMRGHEVIFVLVAHSASDDEANFKAVSSALNKAAIPVFGIGPAAPFGRLADAMTADLRPLDSSLADESRYSERIKLFFPDNQGDAELTDSGYGPFHLERICRATAGRMLRTRPSGSPGWATGDDGEIKPDLLRKYAPDYVNEEEYQKILAENRACRALHDAAKLPAARVLIAPTSDFHKEEEARMNRTISQAQRAAAVPQQALERLQQTLAAGEADRPKLARPRWQAAFDLAYGRACAARARNDGYNHMLAVLKNGKTFTKADSTIWSLKPAEGIPGNSGLDKMARNAQTYLQRVVKEHAGTPWAAMAARELETPCGWEWTER